MQRRSLLKRLSMISLAPCLPLFLQRTSSAAPRDSSVATSSSTSDHILVVVQLDGGNDGLNTVIPFSDEDYSRLRPTLAIKKDEVIKVNDRIGLHPSMRDAADLLETGKFSIVQGVGYPNPNRSHFESMAIWHHGQPDLSHHDSTGWLGRSLDAHSTNESVSTFVGDSSTPIALRGHRSVCTSIENANDLNLVSRSTFGSRPDHDESIVAFVHRTVDQSLRIADQFASDDQNSTFDDSTYPGAEIGQRLKLVSRLIKLDGATRVFYVQQGGYDTHSLQRSDHGGLLRDFSRSIKAFLDDMQSSGFGDRVSILAFSEFGRRVKENGSEGTDHGAAGPVFLAGAKVPDRVIGEHPSLTQLDRGDLKHSIDFREVYASVLSTWMGLERPIFLDGFRGELLLKG